MTARSGKPRTQINCRIRSFHLKQLRHDFPGIAFDYMRKRSGIQRRLWSHIDSARAASPRPMHKVGRRINRARSSHHEHQSRAVNLPLDLLHLQWNFAKEDDVRAQPATAGAEAHLGQVAIYGTILNRRPSALPTAARLVQFSVHMHQPH